MIAAPAWRSHHHVAGKAAVLFRVTDAPGMAVRGLLRGLELEAKLDIPLADRLAPAERD